MGIEFPKNVVEEQDRRLLAGFMQEGGLGQLERQGDGALLAFGGEGPRRKPIQSG